MLSFYYYHTVPIEPQQGCSPERVRLAVHKMLLVTDDDHFERHFFDLTEMGLEKEVNSWEDLQELFPAENYKYNQGKIR